MKIIKHDWTKNDLMIAYYITKWDYSGLGIDENDIVDSVIPNTTVHSLNMQVANFRHLLNIDGYKLSDSSKLMGEIVDKYESTPMLEVRKIVLDIIDKSDIKIARVGRSNKIVDQRKLELNAQLNKDYEAKLKMFASMGRRLKKVA
jgi:hypothetical protein